jgi:hypothetical protein
MRGKFETFLDSVVSNGESPKEVFRGRPETVPPNHVVWSHVLKCSVKSHVIVSSTNAFATSSIHRGHHVLTHDEM